MSPSLPELRILGVDPGSRVTGWGIIGVSGNELRSIDYGIIKLPGKAPFAERLVTLFEEMLLLIERTGPAEAAVEEVYVARDVRAALTLGQARGVIMLACAQRGLVPFEYPANTVKQAVLGQAGASATKERIAFMVKAILGLKETPEPADITDALACAICHAHRRELPV